MSRIKWFPLVLALAAAPFSLPGMALAHEGDFDLAGFHLSYLTAYILGGAVGGVLLLALGVWALANWSLKKQEKRKGRPTGEGGS